MAGTLYSGGGSNLTIVQLGVQLRISYCYPTSRHNVDISATNPSRSRYLDTKGSETPNDPRQTGAWAVLLGIGVLSASALDNLVA